MLSEWKVHFSKIFLIPQRYILGIMGFLAVVNAYTMRISLSVAITEMVLTKSFSLHHDHNDTDSCPEDALVLSSSFVSPVNSSIVEPNDKHLYPWTSTQQGLILSSFYWGYVLTHIPGGLIAQKFGGKYSLGMGILCTAIFTLITPFVIYATDGKWQWVVALRVIEGLGEGTTFPALNALLAQWVPASERSKIGTLVFAGSQIGTVVGNSVSGFLIASTQDWASVFYFFGSIAIFWVFLWTLLCYSSPDAHPFISEKERDYLKKEISNVSSNSRKKRTPWRAMLTSAPLWALVAAQIGHDWGFFTMVTDLPKYMKDILKFNVKENGLWSSIPYIFMWLVSMGAGWTCDAIIKRQWMGVTFARKFFTTIASMGPAVFILAASYSGCDRHLAVAMFTIAMSFMGTFYCGMKVNALDLAPNYAGMLMAIVNGVGAITGIIVPYLVGALTEDHTQAQWRTVFWITFAVFAVTNFIFVCFASGQVQSWNFYDEEDSETPDESKQEMAEEKRDLEKY